MSKQGSGVSLGDLSAEPCCSPLAEGRISAEAAGLLAPAFKALGDPVRLQSMSIIASAPDGDLSGPTISHHLRTLREAGLVNAERRGTWVYYRARPGLMRQLAARLAIDATAPVA